MSEFFAPPGRADAGIEAPRRGRFADGRTFRAVFHCKCLFSCGVAVAGPNQTSADYVMPGCRDAASLALRNATEAFLAVLDAHTLADLIKPQRVLSSLLLDRRVFLRHTS